MVDREAVTLQHRLAWPVPGSVTFPWPWFGVATVLALALRLAVLDPTNLDLIDHFVPWLEDIHQRGFWAALSHPFSQYGYTPFYSYAMGLADWLLPAGTDPKIVIKSVSIVFDFIAAGLVALLAFLRWRDYRHALAGYAAILFAPTVVLNGAYWGQSDIVYTSFLLVSLLGLLRGRALLASVAFGCALAIKLQAAWFGPFFLMMVLRGRLRWWALAILPLCYLVLALPALVVGRSLMEVATIYLTQAGTQSSLNYSAANVQFFPQYFLIHLHWAPELAPLVAKLSVMFTAALGLVFAWKASKGELDDETLILAALASVLIAPQFLPHMHNRYFFSADILAILLALWRPRYWPAALLMQATSAVTYVSFLWGSEMLASPVPGWLALFGFTNNLQPITGLEALAGLANLALLVWCWTKLTEKLGLTDRRSSRHCDGPRTSVLRT